MCNSGGPLSGGPGLWGLLIVCSGFLHGGAVEVDLYCVPEPGGIGGGVNDHGLYVEVAHGAFLQAVFNELVYLIGYGGYIAVQAKYGEYYCLIRHSCMFF
jgi:hypothetical protein